MLKIIKEIKLHTEAGSILEHMYLFDTLEELHNDTMSLMATAIDKSDILKDIRVNSMNTIIDGEALNCPSTFREEIEKMRTSNSL